MESGEVERLRQKTRTCILSFRSEPPRAEVYARFARARYRRPDILRIIAALHSVLVVLEEVLGSRTVRIGLNIIL